MVFGFSYNKLLSLSSMFRFSVLVSFLKSLQFQDFSMVLPFYCSDELVSVYSSLDLILQLLVFQVFNCIPWLVVEFKFFCSLFVRLDCTQCFVKECSEGSIMLALDPSLRVYTFSLMF